MKLKKIVLHAENEIMNSNEMKMIRGGLESKYICFRFKDVEGGGRLCYAIHCYSDDLAKSWPAFWQAAGWEAACKLRNESSNLYFC